MHLRAIDGGKAKPGVQAGLEIDPRRHNNSVPELVEFAITRGEGRLTASGALAVETGKHTGRSANDKYIVRDAQTDASVWWDNSKPMSPAHFETLHTDFLDYTRGRELFVQDLYVGADPNHRLATRVFCEQAWHALFIRTLMRVPEAGELAQFSPELVIMDLPGFNATPDRHGCRSETIIANDYSRRMVLIAGTSYAGEMKKSAFSYLNYILPERGVMAMHCSANEGADGAAVFFGLSGTGKTTLSADASRTLIGDDEHGWTSQGLFNFEGGCYAKTIRLSPEAEPEIYAAVSRFGAVLENVAIDAATREPDYDDASLTENSRGAYPLSYISNASATGLSGQPRNIIMLTADAFGVMPPIARLTPAQAMYHFLSGYTAKVAGTEKGLTEPTATFSTCFGAPFMPRHPSVYGNLLRDLIKQHDVACWLVNTGWTGGRYGEGSRMPIKATRRLLAAALSGELDAAAMRVDPVFGFEVPVDVEGVDEAILNPRQTWPDPAAYDAQARTLVDLFVKNFATFADHVGADVIAAGPRPA